MIVNSDSDTTKAHREAVAQRVIDHFGSELPDLRLLCFFDHNDWQALKDVKGKANRGLAGPIKDELWSAGVRCGAERVSVLSIKVC